METCFILRTNVSGIITFLNEKLKLQQFNSNYTHFTFSVLNQE